MGWNAGGFGSMRFPTKEALAAWKGAVVSHAGFTDWLGELEGSSARDEKVSKRLAAIAKGHDPAAFVIQDIALEGLEVSLTYDTGEDSFREGSGDFAALLRTGAAQGAKGTFWFLGTAGAEGDFVYQLSLDGRRSSLEELKGRSIDKVYESDGWHAFLERVTSLLEAGNPFVAKVMTQQREGDAADPSGAGPHARVMKALRKFSDAKLAATVAKFPGVLPTKTGELSAVNARARLTDAKNEQLRGLALWVLGELAPKVALPLAHEVFDGPSVPLGVAALSVFARAGDDDAALTKMLVPLTTDGPVELAYAALDALRKTTHPRLVELLRPAIARAAKGGVPRKLINPAQLLMAGIRQRKLEALAPELKQFIAAKDADPQARMEANNCLVEWKARR